MATRVEVLVAICTVVLGRQNMPGIDGIQCVKPRIHICHTNGCQDLSWLYSRLWSYGVLES